MSIKFNKTLPNRISGAIIGGILGFILGPVLLNPITLSIKGLSDPELPISSKILFAIGLFILGLFVFPFSPIICMFLAAKTGATLGVLATLQLIFVYTPQSMFSFNIAEINAASAIEKMETETLQEDAVNLWNNFVESHTRPFIDFRQKLQALLEDKDLDSTEAQRLYSLYQKEINASKKLDLSKDNRWQTLNLCKSNDTGCNLFVDAIKLKTKEMALEVQKIEAEIADLRKTFLNRYGEDKTNLNDSKSETSTNSIGTAQVPLWTSSEATKSSAITNATNPVTNQPS